MPLTAKGETIMAAMQKKYGAEKGERVFYASRNKGLITGVDDSEPVRDDMSDGDWKELRGLLDKFFSEEERETEHREDSFARLDSAHRRLDAVMLEITKG